MGMSEKIGDLSTALVKFQGSIGPVIKEKINPILRGHKYTDVATVLDHVRDPLAKHGLAVTQIPETTEGITGVRTILVHVSGQWIDGWCGFPNENPKNKAWGHASAITYARRYALTALLGISEYDDDGYAAGKGSSNQKPREEMFDIKNDKHLKTLLFECEAAKITKIDEMQKWAVGKSMDTIRTACRKKGKENNVGV